MRKWFAPLALGTLISGGLASMAGAVTTYNGIEFDVGDVAFADNVVSFVQGLPEPDDDQFSDPMAALGPPNYDDTAQVLSLGSGGILVVEFEDNKLIADQTAAPDLYVFESGAYENFFVDISSDGFSFLRAGYSTAANPGIDIDGIVTSAGLDPMTEFRFVRITDDPSQGYESVVGQGADIDAIGAISSTGDPIIDMDDDDMGDPTVVPLPAPILMLGCAVLGLTAMRRKTTG